MGSAAAPNDEQDIAARDLKSRVEAQDLRITQLLRQLDLQVDRNKDLADQLRALAASDAYRFGSVANRLRHRWIPTRTRRERIARLAYRGLRYLYNRGLSQSLKRVLNPPQPSPDPASPLTPGEDLDEHLRNQNARTLPFPGYSENRLDRRLSLVIENLGPGRLFGETTTAVALASLLAEDWGCDLRVITRGEPAVKQDFHRILELNGIPFPEKVSFLHLPYLDLKAEAPVGAGDVFLTTSWQATASVMEMAGEKRVLYLVQDDERLAYPAGYAALRCAQTLASPEARFIVSTRLLFDHFAQEGFQNICENGAWFEPACPTRLFPPQRPDRSGKRVFLFFAEPDLPRRMFDLGLEVIDQAVCQGVLDPDRWDLVFAGSDIPDLRIGDRPLAQVCPSAGWAETSDLLGKADLGLWLDSSPHPGYPALDLAASGAVVVTNRCGVKQDLAAYSKNILCCETDRNSLVQGLREGAALAESAGLRAQHAAESQLSRDWPAALDPILQRFHTWPDHV
jgi:hypothetical protein